MSPPPKLAFSCHVRGWHSLSVWATVIYGTGVPVPPHVRLPWFEVMK